MSAMRSVWWVWRYDTILVREYWTGTGWTARQAGAKYFLSLVLAQRAVRGLPDAYINGGRRRYDDPKVPTWYLIRYDEDGLVAVYHEILLWADVARIANWYERAVRFTTKQSAANRKNRERQKRALYPARFEVADQAGIDTLRVGITLSQE